MHTRANRYTLGALLGFVALNAFAGGYYALAGAEGIPVEWLEGSAFSSYLVPGVILFAIVGGSAAVATIALFARRPSSYDLARISGWILVTWLIMQVVVIGFVSWLQPATAAIALMILSLAYDPERFHAAWRTS